jgi:hypothetical protein
MFCWLEQALQQLGVVPDDSETVRCDLSKMAAISRGEIVFALHLSSPVAHMACEVKPGKGAGTNSNPDLGRVGTRSVGSVVCVFRATDFSVAKNRNAETGRYGTSQPSLVQGRVEVADASAIS